jgi:thiamine-phosphate pyrophosphorylase
MYRILDANVNRAKEGLRVCEEVCRFMLNSRVLTQKFKTCRHRIERLVKKFRHDPRLLASRDSANDVGLSVYSKSEFSRCTFRDVFSANIQRVKESVRVLEEFSKLDDVRVAFGLRDLRYEIYALEKEVVKRFKTLGHHN